MGYFPTKQFEGYVKMGAVLIAEDKSRPEAPGAKERIGYIISRDRYLKRDELGVIFQLCVAPGAQRGFIGASLLRAVFARSAYGCRLYCCWCAQDLEANYFWEAMGFVPLAFRVGSATKKKGGRVHIFWQKKIVSGDTETKWWYPFQTAGGALRADRVVFPIPEGVSWQDVKAIEVPSVARAPRPCLPEPEKKRTGGAPVPRKDGPGPGRVGILVGGKIKYVDRPGYVAPAPAPQLPSPQAPERDPEPPKPKRPRKPKLEVDPKFLRGARELRDRFLEHVNGDGASGALLGDHAKYDVARELPGPGKPPRFLPAA